MKAQIRSIKGLFSPFLFFPKYLKQSIFINDINVDVIPIEVKKGLRTRSGLLDFNNKIQIRPHL